MNIVDFCFFIYFLVIFKKTVVVFFVLLMDKKRFILFEIVVFIINDNYIFGRNWKEYSYLDVEVFKDFDFFIIICCRFIGDENLRVFVILSV